MSASLVGGLDLVGGTKCARWRYKILTLRGHPEPVETTGDRTYGTTGVECPIVHISNEKSPSLRSIHKTGP